MKLNGVCLSILLLLLAVFPCHDILAEQGGIYIDNQQAESHSAVTLCVLIDQAPNMVDAFGFDVIYDGAILTYTGNWLEGDLTSGFQFLDVHSPIPGQVRVGGFTTEAFIQEGASGTVACLEFAVGDCAASALSLSKLVDDISGWLQREGQLSCQAEELTKITLQAPEHRALLSLPPTFTWIPNKETNTVYVVDFHIPGIVPLWTTPIISGTSWAMPNFLWNLIPAGSHVFWRVRGADLDRTPLTIVASDEVWWFYKPSG